jgi:50S ribosomal subunit-associated GTPase HflX
MNTPKVTPLEENIDQFSQTFRFPILVSLLIVFSTIIILWLTKHRQRRLRHHGECLFLCGISNSGKTLLFNRLTSGVEKRPFYSMSINYGIMPLDYLSTDRPIQKVRVIEIPSNLRPGQRDFNAYKSSAKAIIFVIDSATIEKDIKHVSDYLYNILHEKYFRDQRLPLLIFCNKQDLIKNDQHLQSIRQLLEHELTIKRRNVNLHQGKNQINEDIGRLGKETFEFNDIKDIRIEFVEGSALGTKKKMADQQNDSGSHLLKVHQWIARIWFK